MDEKDETMDGKNVPGKKSTESAEESDVEMDGIDLEGDNDVQGDDGDDAAMEIENDADDKDENGEEQENLEAEEVEEARRERRELLASEQAEEKESTQESSSVNMGSKLDYLVQQSDVFAHFLAGTVAANESRKKKGSSSGSGRGTKKGRLSEAEEDARMLKSADSRRRIIRVDQQPSLISKACKMHDYQMEGLNWLIKLHDHGINGILADEMGKFSSYGYSVIRICECKVSHLTCCLRRIGKDAADNLPFGLFKREPWCTR